MRTEDEERKMGVDFNESDEDQAYEDDDVDQHDHDGDESEPEGEDLQANAEKDYVANPALDHYEEEGLDREEYSENLDARREADAILNERDRMMGHGGNRRMPNAVNALDQDMYSDDQHELDRQLRRERHYGHMDEGEMDDGMDDHERYLDIEDVKGKLSNWIAQPRTQRWIRRIFLLFLKTFKDDSNVNVYE